MYCKFHPTVEAVTKCPVCGADMCSSCDSNAFYRTETGGLCLECSLKKAEEDNLEGEKFIKNKLKKIILATILLIVAIIFFISDNVGVGDGGMLFAGAVCWFLSGLFQTWGHEKKELGVKSFIWENSGKEEGQIIRGIFKVIFYIFAAPVMLIRNVKELIEAKGYHEEDIKKYDNVKTELDNENKQLFEYWKAEAETGDAIAQEELALCYHEGRGVAQDYNKSIELLTKSAEQGYSMGQFALADCYMFGDGVSKDTDKALELYRKAAEQGFSVAQFNLGFIYHEGEFVTKDYATAVKWWTLAAEQGFSDAQRCLGLCYQEGKGVPANHEKAMELWRMAASQGDEKAKECLQRYS